MSEPRAKPSALDIIEWGRSARIAIATEEADALDSLRMRLGMDGCSKDEWNALAAAVSRCRLEVLKEQRERFA